MSKTNTFAYVASSSVTKKIVFITLTIGSPLPDVLHPHELEIIEEDNEADNEEIQVTILYNIFNLSLTLCALYYKTCLLYGK